MQDAVGSDLSYCLSEITDLNFDIMAPEEMNANFELDLCQAAVPSVGLR